MGNLTKQMTQFLQQTSDTSKNKTSGIFTS